MCCIFINKKNGSKILKKKISKHTLAHELLSQTKKNKKRRKGKRNKLFLSMCFYATKKPLHGEILRILWCWLNPQLWYIKRPLECFQFSFHLQFAVVCIVFYLRFVAVSIVPVYRIPYGINPLVYIHVASLSLTDLISFPSFLREEKRMFEYCKQTAIHWLY